MRFITVALWATLTTGMLFTRASFTLDDDRQRLRGLIDKLVERYPLLDNRADKSQPDRNVLSLRVKFKCNYGWGVPPIDFFLRYILSSQKFQSLSLGPDDGSGRYELKQAIADCTSHGSAGLVYRFREVEKAPDTTLSTAGVQDRDVIQVATEPRFTLYIEYYCGKDFTTNIPVTNVDPNANFDFLLGEEAKGLATCKTGDNRVIYKVKGEVIRISDKVSSWGLRHNLAIKALMTPLVPPPSLQSVTPIFQPTTHAF